MYVYCVVCYHVIVAPYVRSVGHVFAYLYILDDDSECPMDYETSLLPKTFFPYKSIVYLSFRYDTGISFMIPIRYDTFDMVHIPNS